MVSSEFRSVPRSLPYITTHCGLLDVPLWPAALGHLQRGEFRSAAEIFSGDERDGLHPFAAKLLTELKLLRGLTFHAAIVGVLIVRMVAEAGNAGIEAFPSGGEIDQRGEYSGVLVEEELHALQSREYGVL